MSISKERATEKTAKNEAVGQLPVAEKMRGKSVAPSLLRTAILPVILAIIPGASTDG